MRDAKTVIKKLKGIRSKYGNHSMLEDKIYSIRAKLNAEGAVDLSDEEIERCLLECLGNKVLIPLAKEIKRQGLFFKY